jgi:hypothetical protein
LLELGIRSVPRSDDNEVATWQQLLRSATASARQITDNGAKLAPPAVASDSRTNAGGPEGDPDAGARIGQARDPDQTGPATATRAFQRGEIPTMVQPTEGQAESF